MAFKLWTVGEVLTSADLNRYAVQQALVVKPSDETVNSTTVQDDDHLIVAAAANTNYWLDAYIVYSGGDIRLHFTGPGSLQWTAMALNTSSTSSSPFDTIHIKSYGYGTDVASGGWGAGHDMGLSIRGVLRGGASPGSLQLRWAQSIGESQAVTVRAGSTIRLTRLTP
ncbi:hypothetical protein [Microtetraspora malaysiensis]|uniref:hypothetical protein n=1 Tax=Microtetraspora malaysiensis TaxID=161358 RepID=UPI003D90938B